MFRTVFELLVTCKNYFKLIKIYQKIHKDCGGCFSENYKWSLIDEITKVNLSSIY